MYPITIPGKSQKVFANLCTQKKRRGQGKLDRVYITQCTLRYVNLNYFSVFLYTVLTQTDFCFASLLLQKFSDSLENLINSLCQEGSFFTFPHQ